MNNLVKFIFLACIISFILANLIVLFERLSQIYYEMKEIHATLSNLYKLIDKSWLF